MTVVTEAKLTPAQRRRLLKKIRSNPLAPYVRCEGCGWVGFDYERLNEFVTPCPKCGHEYARFAMDY